jgi:hypothetical protein
MELRATAAFSDDARQRDCPLILAPHYGERLVVDVLERLRAQLERRFVVIVVRVIVGMIGVSLNVLSARRTKVVMIIGGGARRRTPRSESRHDRRAKRDPNDNRRRSGY